MMNSILPSPLALPDFAYLLQLLTTCPGCSTANARPIALLQLAPTGYLLTN